MSDKVLLILCDGMRPDAVTGVNHPFYGEMLAHSKYSLGARTVMPSVTLPCHMSLFHSVDPGRHGITTNTYVPQVRPVRGLCEVLRAAGKKCGIFYDWEELKDLTRPDSLMASAFNSGHFYGYENADERSTDAAISFIAADKPDFVFLYIGLPDESGHGHGWMGENYMNAVRHSWDCIEKIVRTLPEDYTVIVTADHGGHDRCHGTDMDCDMTIPLIIYDKSFKNTELSAPANIMDIAPTITKILGTSPDTDWEGKSII